jgi:hypothetical protein
MQMGTREYFFHVLYGYVELFSHGTGMQVCGKMLFFAATGPTLDKPFSPD